jgi:hypothetical protein
MESEVIELVLGSEFALGVLELMLSATAGATPAIRKAAAAATIERRRVMKFSWMMPAECRYAG